MDLRRARTAAQNIVPTRQREQPRRLRGYAHLEGKLGGSAMRVPVADGSITDLTAVGVNEVSDREVIEAFKTAAGDL